MKFQLSSIILSGLAAIGDAAMVPPVKGKDFDKMMVVVLENRDYSAILSDKVFEKISDKGILLTNYHGTTHPSQPNYWSMIAGAANFPGDTYAVNTTTPFNVTGDSGDESIDIWNVDTIVDLLVPAGLTYKVYAQDYPTSGKCFLADGFGTEPITNLTDELYRRKHNPFISFKTFTDSEIRCSTQMDFTHLYEDLASGDIADFSYIIPDLLSDDHDSSINYTAAWLDKFVEDLYQSPAFMEYRVLVHINYDEDDYGYTYYYNGQYFDNGTANPYYNATCAAMGLFCPPEGCTNLLNCTLDQTNNKVYSVLLGSAIPSQYVDMSDHTYYDHYSILATVEENWGLGNLGRNDVTANPFKLTATAGARRGLKGSA